MKRSFVMYDDQSELFLSMTDEDAGKLIKAVFVYSNTGEPPEMEGLMKTVFMSFKATLDRDAMKYAKTCERNRKNGISGGRPKTQKNPVGSNGLPVGAKKSHSDSGSVSGSESDNEKPTTPVKESAQSKTEDALKDLRHDLRPAMDEWLEYKRGKKQMYKPVSLVKLAKEWNKYPTAAIQKAVDVSIMNGYAGCFPEKHEPPKTSGVRL